MAEVTPQFPVEVSNAYNAWDFGAPYKDVLGEGVVASGDLAVAQRGAGANNSVDIAAGTCWVYGDDNPTQQPTYRCYNNATRNLVLTQDATNPRIALIVAHAYDAHFSGATYTWALEAVLGTPAGSPVAPALPNNCLLLATVTVPAVGGNVTNAQITDNRPRATVGGGNALGSVPIVATSVAGLGAASNGKQGLLRAGASPYEIVPLTYDSTYGKWVSPIFPLSYDAARGGNGALPTTGGVWTDMFGNGFIYAPLTDRWYDLYTAGLRPQWKTMYYWQPNSTVSVTTQFRSQMYYNIGDTGTQAGDATSAGTAAITTSSGVTYNVLEDWQQPTLATPVANTRLALGQHYKMTNTPNANCYMLKIVSYVRWVG